MTYALVIDSLRKTYQGGTEALRGIDLRVEQGDFFALLGPNGAGKSTAIGIICSLVNKSLGRVEVFGHDLDSAPGQAKACIGLVPQEFNFNVFEPVFEILVNQAGYYGIPPAIARQRAERYLKRLGLWDKRRDMARSLSGGMKRRLMIARALVHEPKLLILDEPTAGVDIEIRRSMWDFLREINQAGTTIILTTHYLEEAENLCKRIAIIHQGEIVEHSSMDDVLRRLHMESFVMDLASPVAELPMVEGYTLRLVEPDCVEVDVCRGQGLNALFTQLGEEGVEVVSLRNKTNRLEEFFMSLVETGAGGAVQEDA